MNPEIFKNDEKAVFALRELYKKYGYMPYKMSKFEEYDLYVKNKDFLVCDSVITFTDTNGKLLALKPDVTLSIIKNCKDIPGCTQKVYYNENVYRLSPTTHEYKEIMQAGLECIGDTDIYNTIEVLDLAAQSLNAVSEDFVLDISHMGIIAGVLAEKNIGEESKKQIIRCISEKNPHELLSVCNANELGEEFFNRCLLFINTYGDMETVLLKLEDVCGNEKTKSALLELREVCEILSAMPYKNKIRFDFSIVNDMNYYNGVVFKGYVNGLADSILSGGQYDTLMAKMGKKSGAIGFAVYLDLLEQIEGNTKSYDVDVLVLYDKNSDMSKLLSYVNELQKQGNSISVQKAIPQKLRYKKCLKMTEGGLVDCD